MKKDGNPIVQEVAERVRQQMAGSEGGHDWWHVYRVWQMARFIARSMDVDMLIVELAALLHDLADPKFHDGNEEIGPSEARKILDAYELNEETVTHILEIIKNISFRNSFDDKIFHSLELEVVQDADRLDAIGAIGIARAFNYGGYRNREMYDPSQEPVIFESKEAYKKSNSPTINHFYEKLLSLKDSMNTRVAKNIAEARHQYVLEYLDRFFLEWKGEA